jgi:hypothetical protein
MHGWLVNKIVDSGTFMHASLEVVAMGIYKQILQSHFLSWG